MIKSTVAQEWAKYVIVKFTFVTYTTIRISSLGLLVLRWERSRPYQRQRLGEMCRFARVRPHLALCMSTSLYAAAPLRRRSLVRIHVKITDYRSP